MKKEEPEDADYEMFDAVPVSSRKSASDAESEKFDVENLYDLIGTLGGSSDITITIDKQGRNGKYELVESYPCGDVNTGVIDMIRDELGPGAYRFRAKRKGDKHPLWTNVYSFTKRLRGREEFRSSNSTPQVDLTPVMEQLKAQNEMMLKMFEQTQRRGSPDDAEEALIRKMSMYKQLFSDTGNKSGGDFDMFLKLIPLVKDLVSPDSGSNTTDLIRDVVKGMTEVVRQPKHILPPQPRPQPALQQTAAMPGTGNAGTQTQSQPEVKKKESNPMMNYFSFLCDRADAGDDPKDLAAQIVEKIDTDNLVELLEQDNLIDIIIAADIRAVGHRKWL